jgi:hypothetical protein
MRSDSSRMSRACEESPAVAINRTAARRGRTGGRCTSVKAGNAVTAAVLSITAMAAIGDGDVFVRGHESSSQVPDRVERDAP